MATPNPTPTRGRRELVSWRLYRVLTGVALLALVLAALAVQHPAAPPPPDQTITVSGNAIIHDAHEQSAAEHQAAGSCCAAGSAGELAGATDMAAKLETFDKSPQIVQFASNLAWRDQPVPMINVIAYHPGAQAGVIAVIAHRDGDGVQPAVGSGMLIEIGRALAPLKLRRGVVLVSTDGGTTGAQGADRFARTWPLADQIVSAITIDSIAGPDGATLRLLTRTLVPRGTSTTLVAAARQAITLAGGAEPKLPSMVDQLSGYAVPYAPTEQSPLLGQQIPAIGLTATGTPEPERFKQLTAGQLGQSASAIAMLVATLDAAPSIAQGGSPVVFAGVSAVRGWLLKLALILLLLPSLACVLLLVARARRRRLPLAPGMWALGWRLSTWLVGLLTVWLLTLAPGKLLPAISAPPLPHRTGVTTSGIVIVVLVTAIYWRFVSRPRLRRGGPSTGGERTIGLTTGMLGLMLAGLMLAAINPFVLIVIVPAAHAWLWIASAARAGRRGMLVPYLIGFIGLVLIVAELWWGQDIGWQTPRALLAMVASGYLSPAVTFCLAVAGAAACQVGALVAGRYAPVRPAR
jgi:hypothetical protein